jgi:hypothetical protein
MKNIHIIPTDKPSRLVKFFTNKFHLCKEILPIQDEEQYQHIYITSDEEIKWGDWFLPQGHINPHKLKEYNKISGDLESYNGLCYDISKCKKIILTTDPELIADGIQAIDDDFLEWFVRNPSCEWVKVRKNPKVHFIVKGKGVKGFNQGYKIIIPKEEPKQETLEESNETTAIRFLEWYRLKRVFYQFHCYHIPNMSDKNWETTVFLGDNSYLNASQLFEIFKKENYE